jgi:hypothetical protein
LAIELADGDVLLFPGDAQVGSWLSWQDIAWSVGNRAVTGPDLLKHTIFYKVGHHGSHNATLKEKGLALMANLQIAAIPVIRETALQRHWNRMPLSELVEALDAKTGGAVLQSDKEAPAALKQQIIENDLYFEVVL